MTAKKTPDQSADTSVEERLAALEAREQELELRERELDAEIESRDREFKEREEAIVARERDTEVNKRSRAYDETRVIETPSLDAYKPPNVLEVPQDPDFHYRWIAEYVNGSQVPRNVQQRIREGYQRVMISDLPEDFIVDEDDRGDGYARSSGLILMRLSKAAKAQRDAYYQRRSQDRLMAADELQGVAGANAVREDRGTRTLTGPEAGRALASMSQS